MDVYAPQTNTITCRNVEFDQTTDNRIDVYAIAFSSELVTAARKSRPYMISANLQMKLNVNVFKLFFLRFFSVAEKKKRPGMNDNNLFSKSLS